MFQFLIHDFKESDSVIIDSHDPEVFKTSLVHEEEEMPVVVLIRTLVCVCFTEVRDIPTVWFSLRLGKHLSSKGISP
jgi:hypothetical protein